MLTFSSCDFNFRLLFNIEVSLLQSYCRGFNVGGKFENKREKKGTKKKEARPYAYNTTFLIEEDLATYFERK